MTGKQPHLQHHSRRRIWPRWVWGVCMLLALAACDRPRVGQTTAEQDEPHFRRGQKLLSTNKPAALEAFQRVIDQRGGDAPESHFEAGRIYLDHFKDYVASIYHFRRYLSLRPNGNYATQVTQMIETAQKEYTRKLAGNPFEAQNDRLDLIDERDKLQAEVVALRAELDRLKRSGRGASIPLPASNDPRLSHGGNVPEVAPAPTPTEGWVNAVPDTPAPAVAPIVNESAPNTTHASAAATGSGRNYVVQKGDTLVAISRQIYGTASQWKAIYEANRDRVPDPGVLKVGTVLRLP